MITQKQVFNIGSAVHGVDNVLSITEVQAALNDAGFGVRDFKVAQSGTETTYVLTTYFFGDWDINGVERAVNDLSIALRQDCIAYTHNGKGYLVGPKAADWGGEFNPAYFIE